MTFAFQKSLCLLPARAGVSLKPVHYSAILQTMPDVGFFEVHAENYMGAGGPPHRYLSAIRDLYPISLHGVGLSLGGSEPLNEDHLGLLKGLVDRYRPAAVSEHLAWSVHEGAYLDDLLPLPYTNETLAHVIAHVDQVQGVLKRPLLLENPSTYVSFADHTWSEPDFLAEIVKRTGCGLLLDINNIYVSSTNQGFDACRYLGSIPLKSVGEIHLAGHTVEFDGGGNPVLIDTHNCRVAPPVWELYRYVSQRLGAVPTLIEWDADLPGLEVFLDEAARADAVMASLPPKR